MRRDCKLILKILRYVRDHADGVNIVEPPDCQSYSPEAVAYHIRLCADAGFVRMSDSDKLMDVPFGVLELTWAGHEELRKHAE